MLLYDGDKANLLLPKVHKPISVDAPIGGELCGMEKGSLPINWQATNGDNLVKLVPGYCRVRKLVHCLVDASGVRVGGDLGHRLATWEMESEKEAISLLNCTVQVEVICRLCVVDGDAIQHNRCWPISINLCDLPWNIDIFGRALDMPL